MHTTETESAHQRFVREARALLKPSPVRLHHVPRWLVQRIRARLGKPAVRYPYAMDYLEHAIKAAESDRFANWLDHWGSTVYGERPAFVSEPYLCPRHVTEAIRFAELLGLDFDIEPNSEWFPGQTTRLMFRLPKGDDRS